MNADAATGRTETNAYDEIPYHSQAFAQTHPDRLATIAHVFGLEPPGVERCRVLELGCAAGGNLIPMAYGLPQAEFVGVDLSAKQVQVGQKSIARLDLRNVRIEHASIMDIDASWGSFDYLICHGVFSWVPRAVQDKVFEIAAQRLADNGIAYISYNTYPGWHMRSNVRHMLGFGTDALLPPALRVAQARTLLDTLVAAVPDQASAYARMLGTELERLREAEDWYLFHEELESDNTPLYFHQFIARAGGFGLQYLAEAEIAGMFNPGLPDVAVDSIAALSADVVQYEQYVDFLRNRHFRQTLLCKSAVQPQRQISPAMLDGLLLASNARPKSGDAIDLRPGVGVSFALKSGAQGTTSSPLTKAALGVLAERWPLSCDFDELFAVASERAGAWLPPDANNRERMRQELFACFASGLINAHMSQPRCSARVGERPEASAWARDEMRASQTATNLRHEVIRLVPFSQAALQLLDGSRSRDQLIDALDERVADGTLALPPASDAQVEAREMERPLRRAYVAAWLDDTLARLANYALLMA